MQRRSALDNARVPPALLKSAPRDVRANASGRVTLIIAAALTLAGIFGAVVLGRRAEIANRHVRLFASERILAAGDVIRLQKRGGDDDYRITAHYRYTARGQELMGQTTLRRSERERYAVGSPVGVWYLPSEPEQSWLDGYTPRGEASWPAAVVPFVCGVTALVLIQLVRRQAKLLANGRSALAAVTKVEKKNTGEGTVWMVHYEW
jgi:hypothetical protein